LFYFQSLKRFEEKTEVLAGRRGREGGREREEALVERIIQTNHDLDLLL